MGVLQECSKILEGCVYVFEFLLIQKKCKLLFTFVYYRFVFVFAADVPCVQCGSWCTVCIRSNSATLLNYVCVCTGGICSIL